MTAGTRGAYRAYARLVLETMPEESRVGLTLGFVRTFGIPDIARVLAATGRMTNEPRGRAKATGVAMFTLIGKGLDSEDGRRVVDGLRRVHDRPGITPELMHYVLACFTVCPLRFIDAHGHRAVTEAERDAAYLFHLSLADALGMPELSSLDGELAGEAIGGAIGGATGDAAGGATGGVAGGVVGDAAGGVAGADGLAGVERWMCDYETRHFAPTDAGRALWAATSKGLLAARLPAPLAPLASVFAASLLDRPLREALTVRRPPAPVRALVTYALRARARARRRAA
ncbi:oxygenase MpaB family protein [Streptomyces sp. NPDC088182]|uniref:oxygenase MpaB family protein n=1 Tax=Streptomyces sp. NPDC088182 TaxID=3365838 RepID=UPI003807B1F4